MSDKSLKYGAITSSNVWCDVKIFFELPEDHLGIEI